MTHLRHAVVTLAACGAASPPIAPPYHVDRHPRHQASSNRHPARCSTTWNYHPNGVRLCIADTGASWVASPSSIEETRRRDCWRRDRPRDGSIEFVHHGGEHMVVEVRGASRSAATVAIGDRPPMLVRLAPGHGLRVEAFDETSRNGGRALQRGAWRDNRGIEHAITVAIDFETAISECHGE